MFNWVKETWDGLLDLAVEAVKFIGRRLKDLADAIGLSALPLQAIRGDASLAHAAKAVTTDMVPKATLVKTGAVTKAAATKVGAAASKLGLANAAAACSKIAAASSLAVGTTVMAVGFVVLFVGAIWIVKRLIRKAGEFIETVSAIKDAEETVEGLALVA